MTIDEAIKNREDCLKYLEEIGPKASPDCLEAVRWSVKALQAFRPVSREQVEKVFPGCVLCKWGGLDCVGVDGDGIYLSKPPKDEKFRFCPVCGKPLTDEAVEMVMERLEALKDG